LNFTLAHISVICLGCSATLLLGLRDFFDMIDEDGSGEVQAEELLQAMRLIPGADGDFSEPAVKAMIDRVDTDRSGALGFNEFVVVMTGGQVELNVRFPLCFGDAPVFWTKVTPSAWYLHLAFFGSSMCVCIQAAAEDKRKRKSERLSISHSGRAKLTRRQREQFRIVEAKEADSLAFQRATAVALRDAWDITADTEGLTDARKRFQRFFNGTVDFAQTLEYHPVLFFSCRVWMLNFFSV
jgi:hypothetical protein